MEAFLKIFAVIFAIDALIILGLPLVLVLMRRPRVALAVAVAISAGVIVDYSWNHPGFNAVGLGIVGLVGLPAQVMPLSLALMLAALAICWLAVEGDT